MPGLVGGEVGLGSTSVLALRPGERRQRDDGRDRPAASDELAGASPGPAFRRGRPALLLLPHALLLGAQGAAGVEELALGRSQADGRRRGPRVDEVEAATAEEVVR